MKMIQQTLLMISLLAALAAGMPAEGDDKRKRRPPPGIQGSPSTQLAPENRASVSNSRAASLVKKRYSKSRILGVSLMEKGGAPIYRVRTLSPDGVVRSVFVDGQNGEVFE